MIQKEGPGWRLARDSSKEKFVMLIGGANWAIELAEEEWISLVSIINKLAEEHERMFSQLMSEELVSLEMESRQWWGCLEGDRKDWSLQLIFNSQNPGKRSFECFWPRPAAQLFVCEMRKMWDSTQ